MRRQPLLLSLTRAGGDNGDPCGAARNWLRGEIFAGGRHIAAYANGTTYFDYSDWLGTLRMSATIAGYEQSECTSGPFGEGLNCGSSPTPLQFTGQQHDAETGLDDFPARYYTSAWARWMVPDWSPAPTAVPYANFVNPQSLDLYIYLLDSPVSGVDRNGHICDVCPSLEEIDAAVKPLIESATAAAGDTASTALRAVLGGAAGVVGIVLTPQPRRVARKSFRLLVVDPFA